LKKEAKNFGQLASLPDWPEVFTIKSFLVLFSKKEPLARCG
jgi:hypothetical protein